MWNYCSVKSSIAISSTWRTVNILFFQTLKGLNLLFYQTLEGQLIYSFNSNMTNSTSGEGTAYPSGLHEFTPINHLLSWRLKWVFPISWHLASVSHHLLTFHILIFWKTTGSNWIRLGCDPPWVILFSKLCQVTLPYIQDGCHGFWFVE